MLIDPLTGILNRSGYDENINKEYVRWKRYESNLSLAVLDLDLFKNINDAYGHAVGDKVLSTVARQLESQIRECDILCRYGGEEFVLVLPETGVTDAVVLLEKLRQYVAECRFHFHDTPVPVTMSCGVAGDSAQTIRSRTCSTAPTRRCISRSVADATASALKTSCRKKRREAHAAFFGGAKLIRISPATGSSSRGPSTSAPLRRTTRLANRSPGDASR